MIDFSKEKLGIAAADIGVLMVLLGAAFSGLRPLFGRWLLDDGLTAVVTALYSYVASMALFLPGGLRQVQHQPHNRTGAIIAFGSGLFVGIGGMAYFEALERLPVATVTLIFFTYPAMAIGLAALLRQRWPRPPAVLAIVCVLLGAGLIVGPNSSDTTEAGVIDFAIAFVAPLSWTLLLFMLAGPLTVLSPWSRIGFISGGATFAMVLAVIFWQPPGLTPISAAGWLGMLGVVLVSGIAVHILLTLGVPQAGPERASIAGVFEVGTALVVGWVIFLEPVTVNQGVGVLFIGAALILSRRVEAEINRQAGSI